jgi:hypothetical protein
VSVTAIKVYLYGVLDGGKEGEKREIKREKREKGPGSISEDQPIGNDRFYRKIQAMTSQRRDLRKRGRPRKQDEHPSAADVRQGELPL